MLHEFGMKWPNKGWHAIKPINQPTNQIWPQSNTLFTMPWDFIVNFVNFFHFSNLYLLNYCRQKGLVWIVAITIADKHCCNIYNYFAYSYCIMSQMWSSSVSQNFRTNEMIMFWEVTCLIGTWLRKDHCVWITFGNREHQHVSSVFLSYCSTSYKTFK